MKNLAPFFFIVLAIIAATFGAIFWRQFLEINALGRAPQEPQRPAVINWVDVSTREPSGRVLTIQLGLRDDESLTWRVKP